MKASHKLIELLKQYEGFSAKPYKDIAGVWTIGYGSTHYPNSRVVTELDSPLTEQAAALLIFNTIGQYENAVNHLVTVKLTQNQFDSLVSFTYNLGIQALRGSNLLKLLNNGNYKAAANEFPKWVHSAGKVVAGLVKRRLSEKNLFTTA